MSTILNILKAKKPLFIDGAMGTMLQSLGMPNGANPAEFCMERTDIVRQIHSAYYEAGADIILTSTFGGTKYKLPTKLDVVHFNRAMAENACQVRKELSAKLGRPLFVGGDIGPVGQFLKPLGELEPQDFIEAIREQVRGLVAGGVDLIFIETQFDIAELRAAVAATRMECSLPVFVSMTFEDGVSLTGTSPEIYAVTAQNLGVDAIGVNCGAGPEQIMPVIQEILNACSLPVFVEPNAGLPELIDGETVFRLAPEPFAQETAKIAKEGVYILGGCCGTSPAHIQALRQAVLEAYTNCKETFDTKDRSLCVGIRVTSRSKLLCIGKNRPLALIGERINPTGKKALSAEFQANKIDLALQYAHEQISLGTPILDVNVGAAHVDEVALLPNLVENIVARHASPLCLDSSNPEAIIAALPYYPASALVNSISGETGKMEKLAPFCKLWGAPTVLLPLMGSHLPTSAKERIEIIEHLLKEADKYHLPHTMILIDILALTAASDSMAPRACLETVAWCHEHNLATTLGLSNISFGLPARDLVNSSFFAMAAGMGLTSCIGNPSNIRLREAIDSANLLLGFDENAEHFTTHYADWKTNSNTRVSTSLNATNTSSSSVSTKKAIATSLEEAVIIGDKDNILDMVQAELEKGADPFTMVNTRLIPAIQEVGVKYEKKEYFLPQLLRSASTMQKAFALLKPLLEKSGQTENRPRLLIATVEGDIHDIGKNIVALLLANHGFEIIDLGKDVPASIIVEKTKENQATIVLLSALMTTTMPRMDEVIKLLQKEGYNCPVMVGGAVVTPEYAHSIGAHYSTDAIDAVRVAKELLS